MPHTHVNGAGANIDAEEGAVKGKTQWTAELWEQAESSAKRWGRRIK